jgi:hypothetical protein
VEVFSDLSMEQEGDEEEIEAVNDLLGSDT